MTNLNLRVTMLRGKYYDEISGNKMFYLIIYFSINSNLERRTALIIA